VTVDPTSENLLDVFAGEVPAPEFVFECAGIPGGVATAASVVRPAGTVAVVGISPERLDLNVDDLIFKEVTIRGSIIYVEEFPMAVRMLEQRAVDVEAMTSQVMPLESYDTAFHLLGQTESAVKILLRP
jgi:threonine dehydrogenase-like Zn-dependent dehydrogenase